MTISELSKDSECDTVVEEKADVSRKPLAAGPNLSIFRGAGVVYISTHATGTASHSVCMTENTS